MQPSEKQDDGVNGPYSLYRCRKIFEEGEWWWLLVAESRWQFLCNFVVAGVEDMIEVVAASDALRVNCLIVLCSRLLVILSGSAIACQTAHGDHVHVVTLATSEKFVTVFSI